MKTETKGARRPAAKSGRRIQEKKRRKRSKLYTKIFYGFYLLTIVGLFVGLFLVSRYLNGYLRAFEASQPKYAAAEAARPFFEHNYDVLAQCVDPDLFANESREQYAEHMERLLAGKTISYNEVYSADEDVKRYVVKADSEKIGEFTLRRTGEDSYNFPLWSLDKLATEGLEKQFYTVSAPSDSTVYVNGAELSRDLIVQDGLPEFETVDLPAGCVVPTRCVYEFGRYFDVGGVRVVDRYGEENEVSEAGHAYSAAFNYDDSRMAAELDERVIKVVRRLSCYMTKDYSLHNLDKDLIADSKASQYVRAFDTQWIMDHKSYDFQNMDVRNYVRYSDDCFSVEARYDYKIIYYTVDPEIYPTAYRLYFQKAGDTWKLFDFTLL